jgi:hypothetical protein
MPIIADTFKENTCELFDFSYPKEISYFPNTTPTVILPLHYTGGELIYYRASSM